MDNSLLVGLSAQRVLRRQLDITANNLANLNTTAFKAQSLLQHEVAEKPATEGQRERHISYTDDWATANNMSAGPLQRTSNPLDVAIDGNGFLQVEDDTGALFLTRDGRLGRNADGTLVLRTASDQTLAILDDGGARITLEPDGSHITITPQGQILQDQVPIGRLGIYTVANVQSLEKTQNSLWTSNEQPVADDDSNIAQGYLEGSNVQAIGELTELIRITRAYEGVARMLSQIGQLRVSAIEALAKVN